MRTSKLQIILIIAISLLVGYVGGITKVNIEWKQYKPQVAFINKEPPSGITTVDMTQFWNVWAKVSDRYYDKKAVDPQKMMNGAISGIVGSLGDPFSTYLPPVQNTNFQQQLAGKFEGIGAELSTKDKQIIVVAPLDGSPAIKAGLKAGDIITKVDGSMVAGLDIQQVVTKIRGPKGSQVTLEVLHKGDNKTASIAITRDTITVKSVSGWVKPVSEIDAINICHSGLDPESSGVAGQARNDVCSDKVMYVQLSQFGDATNKDWSALIAKLTAEPNIKGMILDLRNNPGGYLTDATYIASEFLPEGKTVVAQDMGNGDTTSLKVDRTGQLQNIPLIVLINGGSASASEIVAGALKDYDRATLVGEQSFGKGTVQEAMDLGSGAGLHVTIAKWLTPKGTWVHGKGLTPDVKVSLDEKDPSHDTQLEAAIQQLVK
jgi:carboxyl-terminal processing protease